MLFFTLEQKLPWPEILDMFGVVGRSLYGDTAPDHFGTLWQSIFTCFVLLTLDDWFDIYSNVIKVDPGMYLYPFYKTHEKYELFIAKKNWKLLSMLTGQGHIIIFLLAYIVVEYFIFLK